MDARWCSTCQQTLDALALQIHQVALPPLVRSAATGLHEGKLQQAVHALKYEGVVSLAAPLSARMIAGLQVLHWKFDLIVPVPLHASRQRWRHYNQAHLLGEALELALRVPCAPDAIERLRATPPQVGLSRAQRQSNVEGAFAADPSRVAGAVVLLVDDVFTTGATLQACARALLAAGAPAVYSLTVTAARP